MLVRWTLEESELLKKLWPDTDTKVISSMLINRSPQSVWTRAKFLGLKRSEDFIEKQQLLFAETLRREGVKTRFSKGHQSKNKGVPMVMWMAPEKMENVKKTQFKKGMVPHNTAPLGFERTTKDGYVEVKFKEDNHKTNFKLKHRLIYESCFGPIPEGCIVVFADGDKMNFEPDNLKLKTMKENLMENILSDSCIVKRIDPDVEIQNIMKSMPELIEQKRKTILLNRKIKENVSTSRKT